MAASDRCDTDVAPPATGARPNDLSAREREAREACQAAKALARRQAETMAAARQADYNAAAADTAPAANADAYRPQPMQPPVQADLPASH